MTPDESGPGDGDTVGESSPPTPFGGQRADDSTAGAPPHEHTAPTEVEAETAIAEEALAEAAGVPSASQMDPDPDVRGESASGEAPDAPTSDSEGDPVATAVAVVARERDEFRESLIRLQADFENYKKRVTKQQEDLRERAAESLVEKLLPVLDTADLALTHGAGEDIKQLSASLFSALEKEGLEKIDNAGEPFDPVHHDAVAHEPGDGGQEVAEVMRAGYRWRGRVLRPAMVKVRG